MTSPHEEQPEPHEEQSDGGPRTNAGRPARPPADVPVRAGAPPAIEIVVYLGEAALAGMVGNALYDGVGRALHAIGNRWRRQRASDEATEPAPEDIAEVLCAAIRLHFDLGETATLVTEDLTHSASGKWRARVINRDEKETYWVTLPSTSDVDQVTILVKP